MKSLAIAAASAAAVALAGTAGYQGAARLNAAAVPATSHAIAPKAVFVRARPITSHKSIVIAPESLTSVVRNTCGVCHNDGDKTGGLSLEHFDVAAAASDAGSSGS